MQRGLARDKSETVKTLTQGRGVGVVKISVGSTSGPRGDIHEVRHLVPDFRVVKEALE
jgi:hypothetical protein